MTTENIKPDYLFETSWEVCNKVGGIYTVLSSKYESVKGDLGNRYIFIGPDIWKETRENPYFFEDKSLYNSWVSDIENQGIRIRAGRWNIPGKPVAILVDFTTFFPEKDKIFAKFWETYKLDSLAGAWDYVEPALFGYAAGKVIESFYDYYLSTGEKVIAHFHEWMTGAGILYLKENTPQIGTVFTTHATILGRSMAGNNMPLYREMGKFDPHEMAKRLGIISKCSLEINSAGHSDVFTTVSEITGIECKNFLQREADIITPNGFAMPDLGEEPGSARKEGRKKILHVASALINQQLPDDTLIVMTSGRYEFRNKGLDAFIDAMSLINSDKKQDRTILAVIAVPANNSGPRHEVEDRLYETDYKHPLKNEYLTHALYDRNQDPVIKSILEKNLNNGLESKVKIMFVPVYLNGFDSIFNIDYYEFLSGCDLTLFPSFYEPWGYTPLESIALGIPTVTTTLAGFGSWVKSSYETPSRSVSVIERNENNYKDFVDQLAEKIRFFATCDKDAYEKARDESTEIAKKFDWNILAEKYFEAYRLVLQKIEKRSNLTRRKASVEYHFKGKGIQDKPEWKKIYVKSEVPAELEPLKELSLNLWWSWNIAAIELFESIDRDLWEEYYHNPVAMLNNLSFDHLKELKNSSDFMQKMNSVYDSFKSYMSDAQNKPEEKVAYFSMEFGLHESLKTYSGGLGILAGDYLKEASDSNKNITGIGLIYRYGYFDQSISIFGDQIEENRPQKYTDLPLLPLRDDDGKWIMISLAYPGRTLTAKAWKLQVGRVNLYLLDTDIEENTPEDRAITHNLYGGDWYNRFKQELLLGVGGVRLLYTLNLKPDIYHLNEGHAAFAGLERLRHLVESRGLNFQTAMEVVRASSLFTTHTPVAAGHDTFSEDIIRTYIPHYPDRLNISWEDFINLGKYRKSDPDEKFSMSILAANLSQEINGVSMIHGRVTREMFVELYPGYFPGELHIGHVTNGVHYPTWTSRHLQHFYSVKLGSDIIARQTDTNFWKKILNISDTVIWKQRLRVKRDFIEFLKDKTYKDLNSRQESPVLIQNVIDGIDDNALYIGFARRFATYKRAHLLFTNMERLEKLLNIEDMPVRFVFAGKAHPNDKPGQDLIKRVIEISKMPQFAGKIVFLENYDINVARFLVSGVDIWLNTPTRPLEASGTSGEKAVMNGVLNLSVLDGWWAEGYQPRAGWGITEAKTYANQAFQDELDAEIIYQLLEEEILPAYFDRDKQGVSHKWVSFIKNNLADIVPRFNMKRMIDDYYEKFYSKLFERNRIIRADNFRLAFDLMEWKQKIIENWDHIEVVSVRLPDSNTKPLKLGENFEFELIIKCNGIDPGDIGVDIVLGQKVMDKVSEIIRHEELALSSSDDATATFSGSLNLTEAGVFDFAFRIYPKNEKLPHRQDFPIVKWI